MEKSLTDKKPLEIGDSVIITDPGKLYSSYDMAAKVMGLRNWSHGNSKLDREKTYLIINDFVHHIHHGTRILGITDGIKDFIIGIEGVSLSWSDKKIEIKKEPPLRNEPAYFDINNLSI